MKIKCVSNKNLVLSGCHILIYNSKNEEIINDYTNNMGYLYFDIPCFDIYKAFLLTCYISKCITFIPNQTFDTILFNINRPHIITIKLKDQKYKDLLIEKGKIILWQNM